MPRLTDSQKERYERHLLLPEVGEEGQERLLETRVLIVGAGGLGSPVALYLAAAGVGNLGVVDDDTVSLSNLQRQVIHSTVGVAKVYSASEAITKLNPDVHFTGYDERLTPETVGFIVDRGWDLVIDACDNAPTRYLLNRVCMDERITLIHGSCSSYEGQVTTFIQGAGPCYQCLYPNEPSPRPPRPRGVLGVVPGVIGMLQATEALKVILEIGENLVGRLLVFNALKMNLQELPISRSSSCPACN